MSVFKKNFIWAVIGYAKITILKNQKLLLGLMDFYSLKRNKTLNISNPALFTAWMGKILL